jgi:hypothetical protein
MRGKSVGMTTIRSLGYVSRKAARAALYWRTRLLYDFDIEHDQVAVAQALALMSFWYEDPNDKKEAWYWIGVANLVLTPMDIFRSPATQEARSTLLRRIWWSCFIRDALLSLAMGRPMRFYAPTHSLGRMLTVRDFEITRRQQDAHQQHTERASLFIHMTKLCVCLSRVLNYVLTSNFDPDAERWECKVRMYHAELKMWLEGLSEDCLPSVDDDMRQSIDVGVDVSRILLLMAYHAVVWSLHSPQVFPLDRLFSSPCRTDERGTDHWNELRHAAREISHLAERCLKKKLVLFLPVQV